MACYLFNIKRENNFFGNPVKGARIQEKAFTRMGRQPAQPEKKAHTNGKKVVQTRRKPTQVEKEDLLGLGFEPWAANCRHSQKRREIN